VTAVQDDLAGGYRVALAAYVRSPDEAGRARAYALGHRAVELHVGLLDLVAIHRLAMADCLAEGPATGARVGAAMEFLAESLSTFEMAQRGYREAQQRAAVAHDIALTLQRSLLPTDLPVPAGLDVAVRYVPAGRDVAAGGDWYDVVPLDGTLVGLVVGDVMGHGIDQAATMGQLRLGLRAYLLEGHPIDQTVARTDRLLRSLGGGRTATLVLGVVDTDTHTVTLASAGHPPPLLVEPGAGGARYLTGGHGQLLGLAGTPDRPVHGPVTIAPGSRLLMYTDGVLEQHERAGRDAAEELRRAAGGEVGGAEELCDRVSAAMIDGEPGDDVCLLAAEVLGSAGAEMGAS
jgi:serine phosphatase RsbU (regulator of sigma subunit)